VRAISSSPGRLLSSPGGGSGTRSLARSRHATATILALRWPYNPVALDIGWAVFSALNLVAIFWFANWETIPFHFIWISLTVLYGFQP